MRSSIFLSFILLCCSGSILYAQPYPTFNPYNFNRVLVKNVNRDAEKMKTGNVASRTFEKHYYSSSGRVKKAVVTRKTSYNRDGQITREIQFNERGKITYSTSYQYNEKGQVIQKTQAFGHRQKKVYTWDITYHNDSLISTITNTLRGKKTWGYLYLYSDDNLIKESRSYSKDKLDGRVEYDYYPDRSKKEVRFYKDSIRLEKTFRYDCGITNSLLSERQKDTLTRCSKKEELEDGTIRTIEETRDEKGRIVRTVYDYHPEQKWSETRAYDSKNRIRNIYRRDIVSDGQTKVKTVWYKKGKEKRTWISLESRDHFGAYNFQSFKDDRVEYAYSATYTFY